MSFDARDPGTASADWRSDARFQALPVLSLTGVDRMIVVAAHPDDETLGAGALLASAAALGIPTSVVVVTDGAASHPGSPSIDAATLAATRAAEVHAALHLLNPEAALTLLGFPDGRVRENRPAIAADLRPLLSSTAPGAPVPAPSPAAALPAPTPAAALSNAAPALPAPAAALSEPTPAAGGRTLLVCPWRGDGHRDHRVIGEICAALAAPTPPPAPASASATASAAAGGAVQLLEYPIWLWHWGSPSAPAGEETAAPWSSFTALPVSADIRAAKRAAVAAHRSQTEPLSAAQGDEALLNPTFLQNFDHDREVFIVSENAQPEHQPAPATPAQPEPATPAQPVPATDPGAPATRAPQLTAGYFDDTYARHDDPWGFTDRWYEERKRAVTLSALPRAHFANTFEIGCSIGVLTAQLAPRTDRLLGVDIAPAAIERARQRLAGDPHVELAVLDVAHTFPSEAGPFDLILLSEVGYYFDEATLRRVLDGVTASLRPDGVFVACHWRHPVADYLQSGDGVHSVIAEIAGSVGWTRLAHHLEEDFVLDVYAPDKRSVAGQTGLL